jgi:phenylacetate-coenzyme A ligase PaaK-like adenylate-forming protein
MLETQIRAKWPLFQTVYESMPDPVRNLLTTARGVVLSRNRYHPEMYKLLRRLRAHEKWDRPQLEAFQLSSIRQTIERARKTVPFYASYEPARIRTVQDIAQYPVLTREVVRTNADRFISTESCNGDCIRVGTTGTTGASLRVAYSESVARNNWAFHMRRWAWAGVAPRSPRISLFGSRVIPPDQRVPPFWSHNAAERQTLLSIFHLSDTNAPHYLEFLREHTGMVLEGFPSVLAILADYILSSHQPIPMRVIFTDGEPLYPFLRESIERAFSTRVFDLYGNTELCGLIHECEFGKMHAIEDYAYLEILDDAGEPVEPGCEGYFVWTGFVNHTMPLIRYRIGDRGCWDASGPCSCGRAFPLVVATITRDSDNLRCPDGRIFSPRALNQCLKGASSLRFCQLLHERPGQVLIRGVSGGPAAIDDLMTIRKNLQEVLGPLTQVSATLADAPLVRAGGKIPLIIQFPLKSSGSVSQQTQTA